MRPGQTVASLIAAALAGWRLRCPRHLILETADGWLCPVGGVLTNRWQPYGTRKMDGPAVLADKIGGFSPNEIISVDGWVRGTPINAHKQPPFNSDIWLRLSDHSGWVAWAETRGVPTSEDPTGLADGGTPAPAPAACELPQPAG